MGLCQWGYSREAIWKKSVLTSQATPVVNAAAKSAHFHEPLSFLMAAMVAKHGN